MCGGNSVGIIRHGTPPRNTYSIPFTIARNRYQAGYSSYLEELDAQRGLLSAQLASVQLAESRLVNAITLYQALGGGWSQAAK